MNKTVITLLAPVLVDPTHRITIREAGGEVQVPCLVQVDDIHMPLRTFYSLVRAALAQGVDAATLHWLIDHPDADLGALTKGEW